jgi:hypothetical protein
VRALDQSGKLEEGISMKERQLTFNGKKERLMSGSKEPAFIYRARSCFRPERRLWEFKDKEGKELGSVQK